MATRVLTVNDLLDGQKLLEIDCLDRVYLTLSVPNLMVGGQVTGFLTAHLGQPIPSPALLERRGQTFRRAVMSFAEANDIPVISFAGKKEGRRPGVLADSPWPERKIDQVMPLLRKAAVAGQSRVVAIGVAQEYARVFTASKSESGTGAVWFSYNRVDRRVTCYYFYLWTPTSAWRSSRSAPTSPTRERSGSTGTSGPNARLSRPAWVFANCPTASLPAPTRRRCRTSVTGSVPAPSACSPNAGGLGCRCRSRPPTGRPATGGTSPSARSRSPRPSCSPHRGMPAASSRPSPRTTWTSAARTACRSCSTGRSAPTPPACSRRWSTATTTVWSSTPTTGTPESSTTSRTAARCASRRSSTTPATWVCCAACPTSTN